MSFFTFSMCDAPFVYLSTCNALFKRPISVLLQCVYLHHVQTRATCGLFTFNTCDALVKPPIRVIICRRQPTPITHVESAENATTGVQLVPTRTDGAGHTAPTPVTNALRRPDCRRRAWCVRAFSLLSDFYLTS